MNNDFVLLPTPVVIVLLIVWVLVFGGFCVVQLLLQKEAEKNKELRERNRRLRSELSLTQQELNIRGYRLPVLDKEEGPQTAYHLPEVERNG